MGSLKIKWQKRAQVHFEEIASWYAHNMGATAEMHFARDIHDTIKTLSHSPQIGILDERRSTSKTKYYSFLSHPKYRIIYRFTKTVLYVVTIHATQMKQSDVIE